MIAAAAIAAAAIFVWIDRPDPASPERAALPRESPEIAAAPAPVPAVPAQPPAPEDSVVVRFEDGSEYRIRVGFVLSLPVPVNQRLAAREQYATLRPLAEAGNAAAARALHELLDACLGGADPNLPTRLHCEGIAPEQMAESLDWLLRAARGGDFLAGQRWAERLGDSQEGFEAWEVRWREGDPAALVALAKLYERGVPASTAGAPDPVRAYAYRLVDQRVREAVYSKFQGLQTQRALQAESIRAAGGRLNPQQHAEAQQLAKQILAGNPNCCRGIW